MSAHSRDAVLTVEISEHLLYKRLAPAMSCRGIFMPSPERQSGEPSKEEQPGFIRAARFSSEEPAKAAYFRMQEEVFGNDWDLSVYRFMLLAVSHVAVIGEPQPPQVAERVETILKPGEPAELPRDIMGTLLARRRQARQLGPWVEGHYRPGRPM
jgi:hypothetical protein